MSKIFKNSRIRVKAFIRKYYRKNLRHWTYLVSVPFLLSGFVCLYLNLGIHSYIVKVKDAKETNFTPERLMDEEHNESEDAKRINNLLNNESNRKREPYLRNKLYTIYQKYYKNRSTPVDSFIRHISETEQNEYYNSVSNQVKQYINNSKQQ